MGLESRQPGDKVYWGDLAVTVKEFRMLPLVENEYSRRFVYDGYDNPKIRQIREQERLDQVVVAGKDEFEKQVLLLDWAFKRFRSFGTPTSDPRDPLKLLKDIDGGGTFFCAHYARVFCGAAASMGWTDRMLGLRVGNRGRGAPDGATEHSITEIWSNHYGKWIMMDPTYALYVEKDGLPLNAWELRQEWFYGDPNSLDFVIGAERKRHKFQDMPILRASFKGFGDLALKPRTIDKYAFLMYEPDTNLFDDWHGPDRLFITKDALADGVKWHRRDNPKAPAHEPYFPLNQSALHIEPAAGGGGKFAVTVRSLSPNFDRFRYRVDGGPWKELPATKTWAAASGGAALPAASKPSGKVYGAPAGQPSASFEWQLQEGNNLLEVLTVNRFGVEGTPSKVILDVKKQAELK